MDREVESWRRIRIGSIVQVWGWLGAQWFPAIVVQQRQDGTIDAILFEGGKMPQSLSAIEYYQRVHAGKTAWRYPEEEEGEHQMPAADPENDGYQLAQAFTKLFGKPTPGMDAMSAAFSLGERFAEMSGYQGARAAMDYLRGFVSGLGVREQPMQIAEQSSHDAD